MAHFNRGVILTWILANILGLAVLLGVLFVLPVLMTLNGILPAALLLGLPLGLAQWLALRRFSKIHPIWIATILAGILLYFLIYEAVPDTVWRQVNDESLAALSGTFLLIGFLIGLPQWLLLRDRYSKSWIWLLASSLGFALSFLLVAATNLIDTSGFFAILIAVLVYTGLTGLAISYLVTAHDSAAPAPAPV